MIAQDKLSWTDRHLIKRTEICISWAPDGAKKELKWGIIHLTNAWVLGKPSKTKVDIQKPKGEFLKVLAAKGAGLESTTHWLMVCGVGI